MQLGFHLCYGDVEEAHFFQPKDAGDARRGGARDMLGGSPRTMTWIHLPVPIERDDESYFAPLAALTRPAETEAVGAFGGLAVEAAARLAAQGIGVTVVDPRWALPVPPEIAVLAAGTGWW